jgi:hypothetical protein
MLPDAPEGFALLLTRELDHPEPLVAVECREERIAHTEIRAAHVAPYDEYTLNTH